MNDKLYSIKEAAEYLNLQPATLRNIIHRGEIDVVRIGNGRLMQKES